VKLSSLICDAVAVANVSLRRRRCFRVRPGETVSWAFGEEKGQGKAGGDGLITLSGLKIAGKPEPYPSPGRKKGREIPDPFFRYYPIANALIPITLPSES
jgi:hypothetical protein